MKFKHLAILALLAVVPALYSCGDDDDLTTDQYQEWNQTNIDWLTQLENKRNPDGSAYYTRRTAPWDSRSYVLMHYFERNEQALRPLYTSTVDMRYKVHLCDGTGIDSTDFITSPVPGALRTQLSSTGLISGWPIAITDMHVGDSCEVIIPYGLAYGLSGYGNVPPYSNLRFNMRLVDIPFYEVKP